MAYSTNTDFDIQNGILVKYKGKGGNVVVPSSVTTIGKNAFNGCAPITNITIPNTVKKICDWAFDCCNGLTSLFISASVEEIAGSDFTRCSKLNAIKVDANNKYYKSIDGNLYKKRSDGGIDLIQYAVGKKDTTFTIPSEVKSVNFYAFWGNTSLKNIITNDKTGWYSTIDGNLYYDYGKRLLQYACGKTDTEFTIPEGVEEICNSGCSYCTSLKKVNLPSTLTKIGYNSFQCCENLEEIVIPTSVTEIEKNAFWGCKNLKTVYNLSKLDIKKGAETHGYVAKYADNVFTTFEDFNIQGGELVKYVGKGGNVVIPSVVTVIGKNAFNGCDAITSITIPNTVKKIDNWAFDCCNGLTSIFIPASVEEIAGSDFTRCSKLNAIKVDVNNKYYKSIDGNLYKKKSDGGIDLIQYAVGKKETTFTIPSEVKSLNFYAFWGNTSLKNIITNDKTGWFSTIDGNLYYDYGKRLLQYACGKTDTEFTIPEGVEEICNSGCSYCTSLKKVNLPSTLTKIGYNSFQCCENLQEIVIPASVTEIEKNAFSRCTKLKTVYNLANLNVIKGGETYGYVGYYADNVFTELSNVKNSQNKSDFDIKNGVLIEYKGQSTTVEIPNTVTTIGENAFARNNKIEGVIFSRNVNNIIGTPFSGCSNLTSIKVDSNNNTYKSLNGNLYSKDGKEFVQYAIGKKNETFSIPNGVVSIKDGAFIGNSTLKSLEINDTSGFFITIDGNLYSKYGEKLFHYASGKTDEEFTLPEGVREIPAKAFFFCKKLKVVRMPKVGTDYCEK